VPEPRVELLGLVGLLAAEGVAALEHRGIDGKTRNRRAFQKNHTVIAIELLLGEKNEK